jgi:RHS repeat-associated protein
VQVFFMPNSAGSGVTSRFDLALPASNASPLNWIGAKEAMRPAYIPTDAWGPIYENYRARLGDTVGSYQAALAEAATYLSEVGVYTGDVGRLGAFLLRLSDNWGGISQRYAVGAFGRGLPDPTDYAAQPQPDGTVIVRLPGDMRFFVQTADGYAGAPGEYGVLTRLGSGAFTLRETEGTLTVFRADGKLDHVEDPNGNRMTPQYSGGRMSGLAWTNGDTATFEYNGGGRISRIIDAVGRQIVFTYDGAGEHLLSITDAGGSLGFSYMTGEGAAREHALARITNPDGSHLYAQYDVQGRLSRLSNDGDAQWTAFIYNLGKVTATAKSGSTTVTRQDEMGQLRQTVDGVSRSFWQERDADGNLTALVGPGGLRSTLGYDALGNLDWFRLPGGGRTDLNFGTIPSRLLAAQDPAGHTQDMAFDSAGNLTVHNYPDGSRETYAYDARGNLTEFVNRAGRAIRLAYNAQDLVTRKTYADGSRIDYGYDAHRNVTSATFTPVGAVASSWIAPSAAQVTGLQYDAGDRLTRITYSNGRYVAYTYDSGGRLSEISTAEGALSSYGYDAAGRLAKVGNPANPAQPFAVYAYNAAGQVSRVDYPNGTYTEYQYDAAGRVTSVVNRSGSSVHASFAYTYDTAGRIQTMTTLQGTATYAYDADGRLTSAALPGHSVQYTYDAAGNRISATEDGVSTKYTTNSLDQYTAAGPLTFGYDATGNLATIGGGAPSTYTYDDEGRLTRTVTPAGTWTYEYDVLGNRSAVIKNGVRTEYLVDPQGLGEVVGEYGAGGLVARYVHGLDLVGRVDAGGAAAYYELDALGSVAGLSGAGGALLNQYSYLPFGKTAAASETVSNPFKFVGGQGVMDDGSGLLYMRRRYYAPSLGRFTGPDPLRSPGANAYAYVLNSPLAFVDPRGLAVTADRFGGLEDSFSYGEGAGKAAPGVARAYEALMVAQAPRLRPGLVLRSQGSYTREFPWETRFEPCNPNSVRGPDCFWRKTRGGGGEWVMPAAPKPEPSVNPFAPRRIDKFTTAYFGEGTITFVYQIPGQPPEWSRYVYYNGQQGKLIASSDPPTTKQSSSSVQQVASHDPNDMVGPAGFGPKSYVAGDQALMYTIRFENDKAANAPAQVVRLTQTFDPALDRGAFELLAVGFGGRTWAIPDGRASYSTRFDVRSSLGLYVDFQAEFNTLTGELAATLTSIDPATGALPTNLMSGFLPPNVTPPQGEGFLTYRVRPLGAAASGTRVQAAGRVYFDDNPPIDTPVISNALDMGYPTGAVSPLPATVFPRFTVAWSGSDETGGSGVGTWDLYVSRNGGPFTISHAGTPATSITVQGEVGATYAFYALAIDNTGHRQQTPGPAQTTAVVEGGGSVMLPLLLRAK